MTKAEIQTAAVMYLLTDAVAAVNDLTCMTCHVMLVITNSLLGVDLLLYYGTCMGPFMSNELIQNFGKFASSYLVTVL